MALNGWPWMVSDTALTDYMNRRGAADQLISDSQVSRMNGMLTDVNEFLFLLTIQNPRFLIANYNRSSYRSSYLIATR